MDAVKEIFQLKFQLKNYQIRCLEALKEGKDCFVCQPTGSGKSLVFQSFPFYLYATENTSLKANEILESCRYKALVISPLVSLMKDQETYLKKLNIKTTTIHHREHGSENHQGKMDDLELLQYHVIFASPEAILTSYRDVMKSKIFNKDLKLIAVDESHCVRKWGSSSSEADAFRSYYGRLSELRSLIYYKIPMVALTATATNETRNFVMENLCLYDTKLFIETPERSNIRYSVATIKKRNPAIILDSVVQTLQAKQSPEKLLIFCRLLKDVQLLYSFLSENLDNQYNHYSKRPFAMYHSNTDETVKEFVAKEFSKGNGVVKVLISTIAFGMGINCRGLYKVIHFGPPATLDDYFQESGRIGRDGNASEALLVIYPKCLVSSHISDSVKQYAQNSDICRRKLLLAKFNASFTPLLPKHSCCDICQMDCKCNTASCTFVSSITLNVINKQKQPTAKSTSLSDKEKADLITQLKVIRNKFIFTEGHCGEGINSGFPIDALTEIANIASENISVEILKRFTSLFNINCYDEVITTVREYCKVNVENEISEFFEYLSSSDESSDEEDDSEDLHVRLGFSSDDEDF